MLSGKKSMALNIASLGELNAGTTSDAMLSAMDFFPLILNAAGAVVEPGSHPIDGKDPLKTLQDLAEAPPHNQLCWRFRDGWAIRRGDYKLSDDGLYHLPDDPGETTDLSATLPAVKQELQELYDAWEAEVYNTGPSPQTYEQWLSEHGLPTDKSGLGAQSASPAKDGIENLLKYFFGLNPWDYGLANSVNLIACPGPNPARLALRIIVPKPIPAEAGFSPQISSALNDWPEQMQEIMRTVNHNGTMSIFLRDPESSDALPSRFARVRVTGPGADPTPAIPSLDLNAQNGGLLPYSDQHNRGTGPTTGTISADGSSVTFSGNDWEMIELAQAVTISTATTLQFTFSSSTKGEFHGIALDDNDVWDDLRRVISFYGTQHDSRAVGNFNYEDAYTGNGDQILSFRLIDYPGYSAGQVVTHLCFINDGDNGNTGEGTYSNIKIYE
jgi:hypothetical protein